MATGLIIAGAPFLPKLVPVAKGNAASSIGLMTLLMVVTGEMGRRVQPHGETEQTEAVGAGQPIFGNDLCHTPAEI